MLPRRGSLALLSLALLVPMLRLPAARAQTLEVTGLASAQLEGLLDQDSYSDSQADGPLLGSASAALGDGQGGPRTSCESSAEADYGTLRVTVSGRAVGGPELISMPDGNLGYGGGSATFEDTLTVVPPHAGLSGATGTARVRVRIAGLVNADSGGAFDSISQADYSVFVRFGQRSCVSLGTGCWDGISGTSRDGGSLGGGKSYEGTPLPAVFETKPLPFLFDQPFVLGVDLGATVQADADEEAVITTASSNLGNTLHWDGFVEVRDADGELVDDYSCESLTGIDWCRAVPEPAGGSFAAGAALALLGARAASRRGSATSQRAP